MSLCLDDVVMIGDDWKSTLPVLSKRDVHNPFSFRPGSTFPATRHVFLSSYLLNDLTSSLILPVPLSSSYHHPELSLLFMSLIFIFNYTKKNFFLKKKNGVVLLFDSPRIDSAKSKVEKIDDEPSLNFSEISYH